VRLGEFLDSRLPRLSFDGFGAFLSLLFHHDNILQSPVKLCDGEIFRSQGREVDECD
jgi:hypothetical protein